MNWWRNLLGRKGNGTNDDRSATGSVSPKKVKYELPTARTTATKKTQEEARPQAQSVRVTPTQLARGACTPSQSSDQSVRVMLADGRVKDFKAPKTASQLADFLGDVLNS